MKLRERYHGEKKSIIILAELIECYFHDEIGKAAAALTYYLVFMFFPLMIFVTMLMGFLNIPTIPLTGEASTILPDDVVMIINVCIAHILQSKSSTLLLLGLVFTIWFSMRAIRCLMDAINRAYGGAKPKSVIRYRCLAFIFTLFMMLFIFLSAIVLVIGEGVLHWVANYLPLSILSIQLWGKLRFLALAAMLFVLVSALYFISPTEDRPQKKHIFPGAFAALVAWLCFSAGFAYYVDNMANYSVMYGSIGAVMVFLMWLYFSGVTIFLGAELNHILMKNAK